MELRPFDWTAAQTSQATFSKPPLSVRAMASPPLLGSVLGQQRHAFKGLHQIKDKSGLIYGPALLLMLAACGGGGSSSGSGPKTAGNASNFLSNQKAGVAIIRDSNGILHVVETGKANGVGSKAVSGQTLSNDNIVKNFEGAVLVTAADTTGTGAKTAGSTANEEAKIIVYQAGGQEGISGKVTGKSGADITNIFIAGTKANDYVGGGDGAVNILSYELARGPVSVNLNLPSIQKQDTGNSKSWAYNDTIEGIREVIGTAYADTLRGANNHDDVLEGGVGADKLIGGSGAADWHNTMKDMATAALGDWASYQYSKLRVKVDLAIDGNAERNSRQQVDNNGDASGDQISQIENIRGSSLSDDLKGDENANIFEGRGGADAIDGRAGSDTVSYHSSPTSTFKKTINEEPVEFEVGVTVNLAQSTAQTLTQSVMGETFSNHDAAGDILSNIENVIGSDGRDWLYGTGGSNKLEGGKGDDWIEGGGGADRLIGGAGTDTLSYAGASRTGDPANSLGVKVDLSTQNQAASFATLAEDKITAHSGASLPIRGE